MKFRVPTNTHSDIVKRQLKQQTYYNRGAKKLEQLSKGDRVKMQPFDLGKKKWIDGEVKRKVQRRSYEVEANGRTYVRNRRHLREYGQLGVSHEEDDTPTLENNEQNSMETEERERSKMTRKNSNPR